MNVPGSLQGPGYVLELTDEAALLTLREDAAEPGLTADSLTAIAEAIRSCADGNRHALIVRGEAGMFCRGGSTRLIKSMAAAETADERAAMVGRIQALVWSVLESPLMTVSLLNGLAAGPGAELAFAADITYATAEARVTLWYNRLALVPDMGLFLLEDVMGSRAALRAVMTGAVWNADDLAAIGLAERGSELPDSAADWRRYLFRQFRHSPAAYAATKRIRLAEKAEAWKRQLAEVRTAQAERLLDPELDAKLSRTQAFQALRPPVAAES